MPRRWCRHRGEQRCPGRGRRWCRHLGAVQEPRHRPGHPRLDRRPGRGHELPVDDAGRRPPRPPRHPRRRPHPDPVHRRPAGQHQGRDRLRRPHALLPAVRAERLGDLQGLPRRRLHPGRRPGHRQIHRSSRRRRRRHLPQCRGDARLAPGRHRRAGTLRRSPVGQVIRTQIPAYAMQRLSSVVAIRGQKQARRQSCGRSLSASTAPARRSRSCPGRSPGPARC